MHVPAEPGLRPPAGRGLAAVVETLDVPPDIAWDEQRNDFDWSATTVVPRCLSGVFTSEPRWVRLARTVRPLSLRAPVFQNSVADVAAPLHGLAKDEIVGAVPRRSS